MPIRCIIGETKKNLRLKRSINSLMRNSPFLKAKNRTQFYGKKGHFQVLSRMKQILEFSEITGTTCLCQAVFLETVYCFCYFVLQLLKEFSNF